MKNMKIMKKKYQKYVILVKIYKIKMIKIYKIKMIKIYKIKMIKIYKIKMIKMIKILKIIMNIKKKYLIYLIFLI